MIDTQSGSVISATSTAPSWKSAICEASRMTQTVPVAIESPMAAPERSSSPFSVRWCSVNAVPDLTA